MIYQLSLEKNNLFFCHLSIRLILVVSAHPWKIHFDGYTDVLDILELKPYFILNMHLDQFYLFNIYFNF